MSDKYHNYQLLLAKAAQLYERHGVGRPEPFNVFSSLQNKNGYLNEILHSRFLHALLSYRKPGSETRENLKDFLQYVAKIPDFELCSAKVDRECYNIDILITNADKKAVVIENKTNPIDTKPVDQDKQLWRYYKTLKCQDYSDIHLLYLTPDGSDPSPESLGKLKKEKIIKIAYKRDLIQTWLERCQKRAYDEPELRNSVSQYLRLVRKLTGTDSRGKYMEDLKELCRKDNNFVLIRDLNKAMLEAGPELLWNEIGSELKSKIPGLPNKDRSYNKGLRYRLSESTSLEVLGDAYGIWFRVVCPKNKYKDKYDELSNALKEVSDEEPYGNYPCWQYVDRYLDLNNLEDLKLLLNNEDRQEYAKKTAQGIIEKGLKEIWEVLEDIGLVNAIKEGQGTETISKEQIFETLESTS
ncbi:MAG: PD-(D/E)XK nuclease family protein [Gemmatimonadota bacterium]|nr:PD-(D/E)XK nuclease family protein [Gemmatimonadota bacterium]